MEFFGLNTITQDKTMTIKQNETQTIYTMSSITKILYNLLYNCTIHIHTTFILILILFQFPYY